MKQYITLSFILMLAFNVMAQQDVIFTTNVDKDTLRIGEEFKIEFALEGGSFNDVHLPDFHGFEVVNGPFQSMETHITNGKVFQRISYGFLLRPTRAGELIIQPATAEVRGETVKIDPVKLYVLNEKADKSYVPRERRQMFDYSFPPTPTPPTPPKKKRKTIRI